MDLPPAITDRNRHLKEYGELRIESYELLYKAVSEGVDQYKEEIENHNKKIEEKMIELGAAPR